MAMRAKSMLRSVQPAVGGWAAAVRGPKKKKGGQKTEAPECPDLVNIFKERPDPEIYSSDRYPPWLMRMLEETYSPDDVMMQMYRGERVPTGSEQWTLVKSFRRTYLNDQNRFIKEDLIYESDDDIGEDTGAIDEEDYSQGPIGGATEIVPAAGVEKKEGDAKAEGGAAGGGAGAGSK